MSSSLCLRPLLLLWLLPSRESLRRCLPLLQLLLLPSAPRRSSSSLLLLLRWWLRAELSDASTTTARRCCCCCSWRLLSSRGLRPSWRRSELVLLRVLSRSPGRSRSSAWLILSRLRPICSLVGQREREEQHKITHGESQKAPFFSLLSQFVCCCVRERTTHASADVAWHTAKGTHLLCSKLSTVRRECGRSGG